MLIIKNIAKNLRDAFPHPYGIEDAQKFIAMAMEDDRNILRVIATNKEAIGSVGLLFGQDVHR